MKQTIVAKLDKWAAAKTQKEFNNIVIKYVAVPLMVVACIVITIINSW